MVPVVPNQLMPANNPEDRPAILDIGMPVAVPPPRLFLRMNQQPNPAPIVPGPRIPVAAAESSHAQPIPSKPAPPFTSPPTNPFAQNVRDDNAGQGTAESVKDGPMTSTPSQPVGPNFDSTPIKTEAGASYLDMSEDAQAANVTPKSDPDDSGNQTTLSDTPPELSPRSASRPPRLCESHLVVDPALAQSVSSKSRIPVPKKKSVKSTTVGNEEKTQDNVRTTPKRQAAKKANQLFTDLSRDGAL